MVKKLKRQEAWAVSAFGVASPPVVRYSFATINGAHRVGRKVLSGVAAVARPDTILAWYRKLVACKFDGSQVRHGPGRPRIKREVEQRIVRMAGENRDWGYHRIAGLGQSRVYYFRSNGWQCSATPCSTARAGAQAHDHVARLHPNPSGAVGGDRLLYGGGADAARAGDLLRAVFHPP